MPGTQVTDMQDKTESGLRSVSVGLGDRSYNILIGQGLLARAGELIAERTGPVKCAIVTDANVAEKQLGALEATGILSPADVATLQDIYRSFRLRTHRLVLDGLPAVVAADEFHDERDQVIAIWKREMHN